jgi:hypothetical protein
VPPFPQAQLQSTLLFGDEQANACCGDRSGSDFFHLLIIEILGPTSFDTVLQENQNAKPDHGTAGGIGRERPSGGRLRVHAAAGVCRTALNTVRRNSLRSGGVGSRS